MAIILSFSDIDKHAKINKLFKKALIDTNVLLAYSHDTHLFHDDALVILSALKKVDFEIYGNVTTRSEFIDYQRRLIITEELAWLSKEIEGILSYVDIAKKLKAHKNNVKKRADNNNPLVLNDSGIKQFKKLLSISHRDVKNVWLKFCDCSLSKKLEQTFDIIMSLMKLHYLSLRKGDSSPEVTQEVAWAEMYRISERSGLSVNDSMILNLFECTDIPYLITTDFDLVYAAAISGSQKTVFCPDSMYQDYKENYFYTL